MAAADYKKISALIVLYVVDFDDLSNNDDDDDDLSDLVKREKKTRIKDYFEFVIPRYLILYMFL